MGALVLKLSRPNVIDRYAARRFFKLAYVPVTNPPNHYN